MHVSNRFPQKRDKFINCLVQFLNAKDKLNLYSCRGSKRVYLKDVASELSIRYEYDMLYMMSDKLGKLIL